jgi:hypothetical protein
MAPDIAGGSSSPGVSEIIASMYQARDNLNFINRDEQLAANAVQNRQLIKLVWLAINDSLYISTKAKPRERPLSGSIIIANVT